MSLQESLSVDLVLNAAKRPVEACFQILRVCFLSIKTLFDLSKFIQGLERLSGYEKGHAVPSEASAAPSTHQMAYNCSNYNLRTSETLFRPLWAPALVCTHAHIYIIKNKSI